MLKDKSNSFLLPSVLQQSSVDERVHKVNFVAKCLPCQGSKVDVSIGNTEFMLLLFSLLMNNPDGAKGKPEKKSRGILRLHRLISLPALGMERKLEEKNK